MVSVDRELTEAQWLASIWEALNRLEGVLAQPTPQMPVPQVTVAPPDLSEIVTAVTSLKQGVTADEIAQAIKATLAPTVTAPSGTEVLEKVAASLEKLDFRLKGIGAGQAYGGAAGTGRQIVTRVEEAVELGTTTLAALETINAIQSGAWTVSPGTGTGYFRTKQFSATASRDSTVSSAVSQTLIAANTSRLGLTMFNDANTILRIAFGIVTVSAINFDNEIPANGYYEIPFGWTGAISGIWDGVPVGSLFTVELT